MANLPGESASLSPDADADGFDHWLTSKSFSMLAPMCRMGLFVVLVMLLVVDPVLHSTGVWGGNPQHFYLVIWHACAVLYFLLFLVSPDSARRTCCAHDCWWDFLSLAPHCFPGLRLFRGC